MKLLAAIMIFFSSSAYGMSLSLEMKNRIFCLEQIQIGCLLMKNEMEYGTILLSELFDHLSERTEGEWKLFFSGVSKAAEEASTDSFYEIWEKNTRQYLDHMPWKKEDRMEFIELGKGMGYLDRQMQLDQLKLYQIRLNQKIQEGRKLWRDKGKIYQTLGVMTGLMTVILLI